MLIKTSLETRLLKMRIDAVFRFGLNLFLIYTTDETTDQASSSTLICLKGWHSLEKRMFPLEEKRIFNFPTTGAERKRQRKFARRALRRTFV